MGAREVNIEVFLIAGGKTIQYIYAIAVGSFFDTDLFEICMLGAKNYAEILSIQ